ncbi:hypothetical protein WAJ71_19245, partial [Acinetobacter baumannii]
IEAGLSEFPDRLTKRTTRFVRRCLWPKKRRQRFTPNWTILKAQVDESCQGFAPSDENWLPVDLDPWCSKDE